MGGIWVIRSVIIIMIWDAIWGPGIGFQQRRIGKEGGEQKENGASYSDKKNPAGSWWVVRNLSWCCSTRGNDLHGLGRHWCAVAASTRTCLPAMHISPVGSALWRLWDCRFGVEVWGRGGGVGHPLPLLMYDKKTRMEWDPGRGI